MSRSCVIPVKSLMSGLQRTGEEKKGRAKGCLCPGRDSAQIRACVLCLRLEQVVKKIKVKAQ